MAEWKGCSVDLGTGYPTPDGTTVFSGLGNFTVAASGTVGIGAVFSTDVDLTLKLEKTFDSTVVATKTVQMFPGDNGFNIEATIADPVNNGFLSGAGDAFSVTVEADTGSDVVGGTCANVQVVDPGDHVRNNSTIDPPVLTPSPDELLAEITVTNNSVLNATFWLKTELDVGMDGLTEAIDNPNTGMILSDGGSHTITLRYSDLGLEQDRQAEVCAEYDRIDISETQ